MKKLLFSLFLALIGVQLSQAQVLDKWYVGIGTGLVSAKLEDPEGNFMYDRKAGFQGTFRVEYYPFKVLGFATDIGFVQKGGKSEFALYNTAGDSIGSVDGKVKLNYMQIPILLKLRVGNKVRFSATGGFYTAFLQAAYNKIKDDQSEANTDYSNADLGYVAGFGLAYQFLHFLSLEAEFSNSQGFIDINKNTQIANKLKNSANQFKLTLLFNL